MKNVFIAFSHMKQRVVTTLLRFSFFSNLPCVASLRIRRANQSLECLDQKLGNIQNWTKEGNAPLAKDTRRKRKNKERTIKKMRKSKNNANKRQNRKNNERK